MAPNSKTFCYYKTVGIVAKDGHQNLQRFTTLIWVKILLSARAEKVCIVTFPFMPISFYGRIEFSFTLKHIRSPSDM